MKIRSVTFVLISSIVGLVGWQESGNNDTSPVKAEIEASVEQASKAWEYFPKSLDRAGLLKHYAAH